MTDYLRCGNVKISDQLLKQRYQESSSRSDNVDSLVLPRLTFNLRFHSTTVLPEMTPNDNFKILPWQSCFGQMSSLRSEMLRKVAE